MSFLNVKIEKCKSLFQKKFILNYSDNIKHLTVSHSMDILNYLHVKKLESLSLLSVYNHPTFDDDDKIVNFVNGLTELKKMVLDEFRISSKIEDLRPMFRWKELIYRASYFYDSINFFMSSSTKFMCAADDDFHIIVNCGKSNNVLAFFDGKITELDSLTVDFGDQENPGGPIFLFLYKCIRLLREGWNRNSSKVRFLKLTNSTTSSISLPIPGLLNMLIEMLDFVEELHLDFDNFDDYITQEIVQEKFTHVKSLLIFQMTYRTSNFTFASLRSVKIKNYEKEADSHHLRNFAANHAELVEFKIGCNLSHFDPDLTFLELYKLMPHIKVFGISNFTMTRDEIEVEHFHKILSNEERSKIN